MDPYRHQLAPAARRPSSEPLAQEWYVAEGQHGERLLAAGQIQLATEVFEALLRRLGPDPSYAAAVALGRLARCLHLSGHGRPAIERLHTALGVVASLAPTEGVKSLRGRLLSELGEAFRATGLRDQARRSLMEALAIAEELQDLRGQGVELSQLGALAVTEGNQQEALDRYGAALALFQRIGEAPMEAAACHQLGLICEQSGRPDDAEAWYRKAVEADRRSGNRMQLGTQLGNLANLLQHRSGRLGEARQVAEAALSVHASADPRAVQVWNNYGVLAGILDKEAAACADMARRDALVAQARDCRQLQQFAPRFVAALTRLGPDAGFARAVVLGRFARCLYTSGRREAAIAHLQEAANAAAALAPSDSVRALRSSIYGELAELFRALGQPQHANQAGSIARELADEAPYPAVDSGPEDGAARPFRVAVEDEQITDYGLDADLLIDGPCRRHQAAPWGGEAAPLRDDVRPMLQPCVRTAADGRSAVRFCLPPSEPAFERHPGCIVMRRVRREIAVSGDAAILWRLLRAMDGTRSVAELLSGFPVEEQQAVAYALGVLAATGAVDVSGRPLGRFVHGITKKGVVPAGGLEGDEVLRLVTDGNYRTYPEASAIALSRAVPDRLGPLHALTRLRRSRRDYDGRAIARADFDALLYTACGVTGAVRWADREVGLRAYPASGALYAVEIYPVALRVEGLPPGVYHYRAADNCLEALGVAFDRAAFVDAMLPTERDMVAGAAAMICLTARFARHEAKYGEGGYRMLVAETGHVSQNLVLAATALGLSARPFGGVFDGLVNADLGLQGDDEQFLLSVLVGHAGGGDGG